jgi:hypothetical protein
MAFRPQRDQNYFLVPKFIDPKDKIVLGVNGTSLGLHLELETLNSESSNQHFRFPPGGHFSWIKMHGDNYLCVHDGLQDDGAPIIHWEWGVSPNLRFQFIPAGDGYYRIMAMHSSKFMDVIGFKTTPGSGVAQHTLNGGANQLFKLVPVPKQKLEASPVSFADTNEMMREGILGVIGLTPEVGAGLKFIVGKLWTEKDKLGDFWNQMKSYVDQRVLALIKQQKLNDLTDLLNGYMTLIKEISGRPHLKGPSLRDAVIYPIVVAQEALIKKSVELLPYIVGFGCIMISLRRSMVVAQDYKELFGTDIDAETLADNKKLLQATIDLYVKAVDDCIIEAKKWRMGFIPDRQTRDEPHQVRGVKWVNHFSVAQDNYDGWRLEWKCRTGKDPFGPSDHRARADFAVEQRRKQVEVQFDSEMSDFVKQSKLWKNFNPDVAPYVEKKVRKEVGVFGGRNAMNRFNSDGVKRITDVYFHWWDGGNLCGFEIYQDGVTMGVQGCRGNKASHMKLDDDESINSVFGYGQDFITGLWFSTHKGRLVGGGATNDSALFFSGDISDNYNAKLVKIAGANDTGTLQQISFTWEYTD